MTKHPKTVENFRGNLIELANAVGNMRYDKTAEFIESLAMDLEKQAVADRAKGRKQLANKLERTAKKLYVAKEEMYAAWKICEPYMKE